MERARQVEPFAEGLWFAECPRWHDGALSMSDMWDHTVYRFGLDGTRSTVVRFPEAEDPGGLGFLPDGRLLVVGMEGRCVYVVDGDGTPRVWADLRSHAPHKCNDMVVTNDGTAYVSQHGFDTSDLGNFAPTTLLRVHPDGSVDVAADDLHAPNGIALTGDETVVAVAEPLASRVTCFDRDTRGVLSGRRVLAQLEPAPGSPFASPDGICLDRTGAVWLADPNGRRVVRVTADGAVAEVIPFDTHPLAVGLGGPARTTLFVCLADEMYKARRSSRRTARIVTIEVDEPGDGTP